MFQSLNTMGKLFLAKFVPMSKQVLFTSYTCRQQSFLTLEYTKYLTAMSLHINWYHVLLLSIRNGRTGNTLNLLGNLNMNIKCLSREQIFLWVPQKKAVTDVNKTTNIQLKAQGSVYYFVTTESSLSSRSETESDLRTGDLASFVDVSSFSDSSWFSSGPSGPDVLSITWFVCSVTGILSSLCSVLLSRTSCSSKESYWGSLWDS